MNVEQRLNKRYPRMGVLIASLVAVAGSRVVDNPDSSIMQFYKPDSTLAGMRDQFAQYKSEGKWRLF
ncbi:MAG: hypothetical protein WD876_00105 [Candidatus Pacearchaeota archaeon]